MSLMDQLNYLNIFSARCGQKLVIAKWIDVKNVFERSNSSDARETDCLFNNLENLLEFRYFVFKA